nr:tetratricopeptide repeat protein [Gammaproteobacteria bacterium]
MVRKSAKAKLRPKLRPEPAQLKAIERLLADEDYAGAVRRLKPLVQRFPDHSGLRRALVEALEHSEGRSAAGLAAFAWAQSRPNSLAAQEALFHFAVALNHLTLADHTARKVQELGGHTRGFPLDPQVKEALLVLPDGTRASVEDLERFDIGRLHLGAQDFAGALRWLEGVALLPARNNRAVALFHLDRIDDALNGLMASWQADAENLFALGWAVRLRLYRGDDAGARGLCTPLAAATARRLDDAIPQLEALLLLQQDELAWNAFERLTHSDWFGPGEDRTDAALRHLGACAASRLGKGADARRLWQEALEADADFGLARSNLGLFRREREAPAWPMVFDVHQALPMTWTAKLRGRQKEATEALDTLSAANAYLEALYLGGDEVLRPLIGFVLKRRAEQSDAQAVHCLRAFVRLPVGTREERFGLLSFLRSQSLLAPHEPVEFWDGEQLQEIRLTSTEIYREVKESDLPADVQPLFAEAIALYHEGRLEEAEGQLKTILQHAPDHPVVLGNLAAVHSSQGRHDEALRLLRQVVAQHPDYLFARCNLATNLIADGEIDEAEQLLSGLVDRERLHIQEAFALYGALAMLHTAKGDREAARSLLANLESMVEDEDDARRFENVKRVVIAQLTPAERLKGLLGALARRGPKPKKRRR